jgi:FkbM family methyltransferase
MGKREMDTSDSRLEFKKLLDEISNPSAPLSRIQECLSVGPSRKISLYPNEYLLTMIEDGTNFIWDQNDPRTAVTSLVAIGLYEELETALLKNIAKSSKTIFDVGANVGYYSVILGLNLNEQQNLYAFEPIKSSFTQLERNLKANSLEEKTNAFNIALSDKTGTIELYIPMKSGSSATSARLLHPEEENRIEIVESQTLDCFVSENAISSCDLLKIDVEGAELQILQGAIKTIDKFKPVIFTELLRKWSAAYAYHPNDVINLLGNLNYNCFSVNEHLTEILKITDETIETNFIFVHKSQIQKFMTNQLREKKST